MDSLLKPKMLHAGTLSSETREELYAKLHRLAKGLRRVLLKLSLRGEHEEASSLAMSILKDQLRKEG